MKKRAVQKEQELTDEEKIEILLAIQNSNKDEQEDGIYLDDDGSVYSL